ncbi:MAG: methylaspartate mutase subunit E [Chloroflexi bacterium]|nr:methylaspartate mutase subunit E [Chloroflexota bacterium]
MVLRNKKLDYGEFMREREKVLAEWPTGREVDLDEAVAYHKSLPRAKNWAHQLELVKQNKETRVEIVGMGHATLEQQMELISYAQTEGGADFLGTNVDSYTRLHNYEAAERGVKESEKLGRTVLNGFAIVNYGVVGTRKLIDTAKVPVKIKFSALDPRLINEIAFAAGFTCDGCDALLAFLLHNSKAPLETVLHNHQYITRLQGLYEEKGCPMVTSAYGGLALLTPPSLWSAQIIAQALMAAEQGIKNFTFMYSAQGNLVQDVACARASRKLLCEYLDRFGYQDVKTSLQVHNAGYTILPDDNARAFAVISQLAFVCRLAGADLCSPRSVTEGKYIPLKEAVADTYKCAKTVINMVKDQEIELDSKVLAAESEMFEREVRIIMDAILSLGEGDTVMGILRAVPAGIIDHPFGTHPSIACKVLGVRDAQGAVRWLDAGNLLFPRDIMDFHRGKLAERAKKQGRDVDYDNVVDDIMSPRDGTLLLPFW